MTHEMRRISGGVREQQLPGEGVIPGVGVHSLPLEEERWLQVKMASVKTNPIPKRRGT